MLSITVTKRLLADLSGYACYAGAGWGMVYSFKLHALPAVANQMVNQGTPKFAARSVVHLFNLTSFKLVQLMHGVVRPLYLTENLCSIRQYFSATKSQM